MRSKSTVLVVAMLALSALAGCGHRAPENEQVLVRLDADTLDMITGAGDYSERFHRVDAADVEITRRCMRAAGFAWQGVAKPVNPQAREGSSRSLDEVRENGYGLSDAPGKSAGPGAAADDPAMRTALFGPRNAVAELKTTNGTAYMASRTGCLAQGHITIYGDFGTWADISLEPQLLNLRLSAEAKADPRYTAKVGEWRDCMAGKRLSFTSPNDLVDKLTAAYRTDRRSLAQRRAAEIKLALQDFGCDEQVRMSATALALRREFAQRLPTADRAEMARLSAKFKLVEQRLL